MDKLPTNIIAGKTGTAQIPVAGHYDPNETNASFVGFFLQTPKNNNVSSNTQTKNINLWAECCSNYFLQLPKT